MEEKETKYMLHKCINPKTGDRVYATAFVIRRCNPFAKDNSEDGSHEVNGIDPCIVEIVQKMNDQGIITVQSCCGHSTQRPHIWIAHESIPLARQLGYVVEMRDFSHMSIYQSKEKLKQQTDKTYKDLIDYRIEPFIYLD